MRGQLSVASGDAVLVGVERREARCGSSVSNTGTAARVGHEAAVRHADRRVGRLLAVPEHALLGHPDADALRASAGRGRPRSARRRSRSARASSRVLAQVHRARRGAQRAGGSSRSSRRDTSAPATRPTAPVSPIARPGAVRRRHLRVAVEHAHASPGVDLVVGAARVGEVSVELQRARAEHAVLRRLWQHETLRRGSGSSRSGLGRRAADVDRERVASRRRSAASRRSAPCSSGR